MQLQKDEIKINLGVKLRFGLHLNCFVEGHDRAHEDVEISIRVQVRAVPELSPFVRVPGSSGEGRVHSGGANMCVARKDRSCDLVPEPRRYNR